LGVEVGIGAVLAGGPLSGGTIGPLEAALGVVATVVLINAVNLFDGLDGLVTSSAAAGLLGIALLGVFGPNDRMLILAGCGALIGFLPHNWNPARMFFGDNGSYTVGTILAAVVIEGAVAGRGPIDMIAAGAVGTVYLVDIGSTMLRRRRAGVPLFIGDRSHTYDRLHDAGWGVKRIAASAAGFNLVSALAVALVWAFSPVAAAVFAIALVAVSVGVAVGGRRLTA
jgi:UDP-GlcNAc:undecaprenyl-phosphate GlcNAc-1-phosphate transferase